MHRSKTVVVLAIVLLWGAIGLAGCGNDTNTAGPGEALLRVALFPGGSTLPAHTAFAKGSFARNGLHVEITEGQDLPLFLAALDKGRYDIVMTVPTLALIAAEKHLDLQIVASMQRQSRERPNAVWITRDPSISTIAQLKGKTIAVPSLTGIITDALIYELERNGVQRSEVHLIRVPFPTMGDQLQAGRVDAVVATIPFNDAIAARGFHVRDDVIVQAVLDASGGAVTSAITSVWCASRTFTREHPEAIAAWRKSLAEAISNLNADPAEARASMESWLKIPASIMAHTELPDWSVEMTPQELAPYIAISKAVGTLSTDLDARTLVWPGP